MAQSTIGLAAHVLPLNPTSTDAVSLFFFARGNTGMKVNKAFTRTGNSMTFTGCYFQNGLQSQQSYRDTVSLGQLAPGTYSVEFIGINSGGPLQCIELGRATTTITFQVSGPLALGAAKAAGWAVYPVPTATRSLSLEIPAEHTVNLLHLMDVAGREIFACSATRLLRQGSAWQLNLPNLPPGVYTLKSQLVNGEVIAQRVILQ
ncbi:MAG: hypothetical protein JWR44_3321 [Hymenobacter sp.]|nr:hypothetical protein [Hymenobacter sp.]